MDIGRNKYSGKSLGGLTQILRTREVESETFVFFVLFEWEFVLIQFVVLVTCVYINIYIYMNIYIYIDVHALAA